MHVVMYSESQVNRRCTFNKLAQCIWRKKNKCCKWRDAQEILWNFVFTVDSFLEDTKDGMPLEEQLRILLDKMDAANASRKPGMFDTMMISWELYFEWRI